MPQQRTTQIDLMTDDGSTPMGDFTELPGKFRYMSMVPQWDFLSFLTEEAARYPAFALHREVEVVGLVEDDGGVVRGPVPHRRRRAGPCAPTGRRRRRTALGDPGGGRSGGHEYGSPLDVLWYRVSRAAGDPPGPSCGSRPGGLLPMIDRARTGRAPTPSRRAASPSCAPAGIEAFRSTLRACLPFLGDRVDDRDLGRRRLPRGPRQPARLLVAARPAVHRRCRARDVARSAGSGINLAIQDAVAAANILAGPLLDGRVPRPDLRAVQRRRELPTRVTQRLQLAMQRAMIDSLRADRARIPLPMRLAARLVPVRRVVSRFLALGVRNESVRSRRAVGVEGSNP